MKPKKILIVDDDNNNLQLYNAYLKEMNPSFEIIKTNRSKKALKSAKTRHPDVILTDWEMPSLTGLELIAELQKDDSTKDIPVIMLTGIMLSSENLKDAFEAGATDFIHKPVRKNEFIARVNAALKLSESYKTIKELRDVIDKGL